jgi:hypothetical protein
MNLTDPTDWEEIAGSLFDSGLVPLSKARRNGAGGTATPFPLRGEPGVSTYFVEPTVRTLGPGDFEPHDGNAKSVVDALVTMWSARGDEDLLELGPGLRRLAEVLAQQPSAQDGAVDPLCYTLF